MSVLLSSLIGFLGSIVPELFKSWKDLKDQEQERWLIERQIELQKAGLSQRLEEISVESTAKEYTALYKTYRSGVEWVDALNGTVRPVLTYAFFGLYAFIKIQQILLLDGPPLPWLLKELWNEEDQCIFAGIISFYFGSRAMKPRK